MGFDHHGEQTPSDEDADVTTLLASRNEWRPFAPRPEAFTWKDCAIGLSRICRFSGQLPADGACGEDELYSDAQHLCLASDLILAVEPNAPIDLVLAVHLHDAEEPLSGLGDPVGPVKHAKYFRGLFEPYFSRIQDAIAAKAGIDGELLRSPEVKRFDKMAYAIENYHLRRIGRGEIPSIPPDHAWPNGSLWCWSIAHAREQWLKRLYLLLAKKHTRFT